MSIAEKIASLEAQLTSEISKLQGIKPIWVEDAQTLNTQVSNLVLQNADHTSHLAQQDQAWQQLLTSFSTQDVVQLGQQIQQLLTQLNAQVSDIQQQVNSSHQQWTSDVSQQLNQIFDQMTQQIQAIDQQWQTEQQNLQTFVTDVGSRTQQQHDQVIDTFNTSIDNIANTQTQAFTQLYSAHQQALDSTLSNTLPTTIDQQLNLLNTTLDTFSNASTNAAEETAKQASTLMQDLQNQLADKATTTFNNCTKMLLEQAMTKLAAEVQEAVVATSVGASTTAALAPVLPELKAIKAATDVILDAIRVWKDLKNTFGG